MKHAIIIVLLLLPIVSLSQIKTPTEYKQLLQKWYGADTGNVFFISSKSHNAFGKVLSYNHASYFFGLFLTDSTTVDASGIIKDNNSCSGRINSTIDSAAVLISSFSAKGTDLLYRFNTAGAPQLREVFAQNSNLKLLLLVSPEHKHLFRKDFESVLRRVALAKQKIDVYWLCMDYVDVE